MCFLKKSFKRYKYGQRFENYDHLILPSAITPMDLESNNMKQVRGRQVLYDFTQKWNLRSKRLKF